jgi:DNA-binding IclR family transcriptional regulator
MATLDDAAAQHVVRTLRVLELLAEGAKTQAEVARGLAVHRRTARRLLGRLVDEGYAAPTQEGRFVAYAATPRLIVLGRQIAERLDLVAMARQHLAALGTASVVTRHVAVLDAGEVRFAFSAGPHEGRDVAHEDQSRGLPLHATAAGKIFLSADDGLLGGILNRDLLTFTANTIATRADLLVELAGVRAQGYAVEDGEHRAGHRAVASGVVDHTGRTAVALGATLRPDASLSELGIMAREAALALSREIGAAVD